ncbi:MAG TPA: TlpA disulfide reductase family protein [Candidatus Deferrimicrobium sp.]|nr:TlpA disulfide reductase family protein [Candidatus Deferrimicrobium sp.]
MPGFKTVALVVLIGTTTVVVAFRFGSLTGQALSERDQRRQRESRDAMRRSVLAQMVNVDVGTRIEDFYFEDLNGALVKLSSLVHGRTVIAFVEPDCPACLEEIELVQGLASDSARARKLVFVSSSSPFHLISLRNEYDIISPLLYDHKGMFASQFKVSTYPTNIIIDENLVIERVVPGPLSAEEIRGI